MSGRLIGVLAKPTIRDQWRDSGLLDATSASRFFGHRESAAGFASDGNVTARRTGLANRAAWAPSLVLAYFLTRTVRPAGPVPETTTCTHRIVIGGLADMALVAAPFETVATADSSIQPSKRGHCADTPRHRCSAWQATVMERNQRAVSLMLGCGGGEGRGISPSEVPQQRGVASDRERLRSPAAAPGGDLIPPFNAGWAFSV